MTRDVERAGGVRVASKSQGLEEDEEAALSEAGLGMGKGSK
jgi:hypothetical protein